MQEAAGLRVLVVPCAAPAMDDLGADTRVLVERRPELARCGGKLQIVVGDAPEG